MGKPVSKTFFIYRILANESIHHSKSVKFCPICKLEDGNSTSVEHKQLVKTQHNQYRNQKNDMIATGKNSNGILITQDFTQLELEGAFMQDLIICKYSFDKNAKDGLKKEYEHFVGKIGIKNDISFVVGAWMALFETNWFKKVEDVKIWSNGGPKHFKISSNMKFLLDL